MKKAFNLFAIGLLGAILLLNSCSEDEPGIIPIDGGDSENVVKSGFVSVDETWTNDKIYELAGKVIVDNGVTLTIEAGTIIMGREGDGSLASALVVAQGGKLAAIGTAEKPIIFTSILDNIVVGQTAGTNLDETQIGLWGGVIIMGYAPVSAGAEAVQIEGIPADDTFGLYGGTDATDNSGIIKYISIRHGGTLIGEGNEINGLTLGGVGSGTVIEFIEVIANKDDGIECFGGTVNITNALVWGQGDDAFDIDQAYSGTIDNFVYIAGAESDHGMEIDGPEGAASGKFTLQNGSLKGLSSTTAEYADFRDGAMGTVKNLYFFNFGAEADLELDDDETSTNFTNGDLVITGLEFSAANKTIADIFADKATNGDDAAFDITADANNSIVETPTIGADMSKFDWTYAQSKGVLSEF